MNILIDFYCRRKIISSIVDFVFVILEQMSSFLGDWFYGYDIISEKLGEFFDEVVTLANKMSQLSMDEVSLYMRDSLNQLWRLAFRFIEYAKANKTKWRDAIISVSDSVRGIIMRNTSLLFIYLFFSFPSNCEL